MISDGYNILPGYNYNFLLFCCGLLLCVDVLFDVTLKEVI